MARKGSIPLKDKQNANLASKKVLNTYIVFVEIARHFPPKLSNCSQHVPCNLYKKGYCMNSYVHHVNLLVGDNKTIINENTDLLDFTYHPKSKENSKGT